MEKIFKTTKEVNKMQDLCKEKSKDDIIKEVAEGIIAKYNRAHPPSIEKIKKDFFNIIKDEIKIHNIFADKDERITPLKDMPTAVIALFMIAFQHVVKIDFSSSETYFSSIIGHADEFDELADGEEYFENNETDNTLLAVYQPKIGIYTYNEEKIKKVIAKYNFNMSDKNMQDVIKKLNIFAPLVRRTSDPNLIPLKNGVFDFLSKKLMPYDPSYIFLNKSPIRYNPNAQNITITDQNGDWDVDSWINSLSDDSEIQNLLWEVISFVLRPNFCTDKIVFFYAEDGENGKGTFVQMLRNLVGNNATASVNLKQFSERFGLAELPKANAILVDETPTDTKLTDMSALKAIATYDSVSIEQKYHNPVTMKLKIPAVFCINNLYFKSPDTTATFMRRLLFIPFNHCFTGKAKKEIKSDYIFRKEILEFVLFKALNLNCTKYSEPAACKRLLNEFKVYQSPVRVFADYILPKFEVSPWKLFPYSYIYSVFKKYMERDYPKHKDFPSFTDFLKEFKSYVNTSHGDKFCCKENPVTTGHMMDGIMPLSIEFELQNKDFLNTGYTGSDMNKRYIFTPKSSYRGMVQL